MMYSTISAIADYGFVFLFLHNETILSISQITY